jgi:hypothetical protein
VRHWFGEFPGAVLPLTLLIAPTQDCLCLAASVSVHPSGEVVPARCPQMILDQILQAAMRGLTWAFLVGDTGIEPLPSECRDTESTCKTGL